MFQFELKKVFSRTGSKISLLLLLFILGVVCYFSTNVSYVNEKGISESGRTAAKKLRTVQREWAGILDEDKIRLAIEENRKISLTPEALSKDIAQNEIAYGWKQGIQGIRKLLNMAFSDSFQDYDYYKADSLTADEADSFYSNRTALLMEWLESDAADQFSDAKKEFLIEKYETLEIPFYYDYMEGWTRLLEYGSVIMMITILILGYLVAGIFSNEFQWKSDAVFFTAVYGRNKAVAAKIKAGFCIVTSLYWITVLLYTGVVLWYLGADGANCPIQADWTGWKSFYHITVWQEYLLMVISGYIGSLFISFLTMLVSAVTKSAVLAVMVPFVLIFIPSFLENINSPAVNKILGLLPDRLLQIGAAVKYFDLYELGGVVVGALPILLLLYSILAVVLIPVVYRVYRRKQIE